MVEGKRKDVLAQSKSSRVPSAAGTDIGAETTAHYTRAMLAGDLPMPSAITQQVMCMARLFNT